MSGTAGPDRTPIVPVILSGGTGSRLWPMSRALYPKQLLNLNSEWSMLQETILRVVDPDRFSAPIIVCNHEHRFVIAEQARAIGVRPRAILLEPEGRDTAAACAAAALAVERETPNASALFLPADHVIRDVPDFLAAVDLGRSAAEDGALVTFGIKPTRPETGYGYIRLGGADGVVPEGTRRVAAFTEKPPRDVAERYLADGDHLWNSGMFLFPIKTLIAELERCSPATLDACRRSLDLARTDLDFLRLDPGAFAEAPAVSIDRAVMERTDRAVVVPRDFGWSDIGSWNALWEVGKHDERGNVGIGDVMFNDASGCYVRGDACLTVVNGGRDLVVVVTEDAVLVSTREAAGDVKLVVDRLKRGERSEALTHREAHRPWGTHRVLRRGDRYQVKLLTIDPGARVSSQRHRHRAEHWVVVSGAAIVTKGEERIPVYENQSIDIPVGEVHRIENPGKIPLRVIEVQSGAYLGEDDIERLDDNYGRV